MDDLTLTSYVLTLREWNATPRWRVFRRRYLRRLANDLADIYLGA